MRSLLALKTPEWTEATYVTVTVAPVLVTVTGTVLVVVLVVLATMVLTGWGYFVEQNDCAGG